MARNSYVALLQTVPAFRDCPTVVLSRIASLVDTVELPPGTMVSASHREVLVTLAPTQVIVIERRALDAVIELAPDLVRSNTRDDVARDDAVARRPTPAPDADIEPLRAHAQRDRTAAGNT